MIVRTIPARGKTIWMINNDSFIFLNKNFSSIFFTLYNHLTYFFSYYLFALSTKISFIDYVQKQNLLIKEFKFPFCINILLFIFKQTLLKILCLSCQPSSQRFSQLNEDIQKNTHLHQLERFLHQLNPLAKFP